MYELLDIVCQFQVVIISKLRKLLDSDIQLNCFEEWILGGAFLVVELPTSASDFVIVIALIKMMKKVAHF